MAMAQSIGFGTRLLLHRACGHGPEKLATSVGSVHTFAPFSKTGSLLDDRRSSFMGLYLSPAPSYGFATRPTKFKRGQRRNGDNKPLTVAVIKRRKDPRLDLVVDVNKRVRIANKIKSLLLKQEEGVMSLKQLGMFRHHLGLTGKMRCIALLSRFPALFEVYKDPIGNCWFRLSPAARQQQEQEEKLRASMEEELVNKVRKLLMMSFDRRLHIANLEHLKRDLGLPDDYHITYPKKYPQYFKLVDSELGRALELVSWDPALAVSALEQQQADSLDIAASALPGLPSGNSSDFSPSGEEVARALLAAGRQAAITGKFRNSSLEDGGEDDSAIARKLNLALPPGYHLTHKDQLHLVEFLKLPPVSPYAPAEETPNGTKLAERRWVSVLHEVLTLTLEKRLIIDNLTHFRNTFKLTNHIWGLLVRHPEYFYVSLKGHRHSVFLREAYDGSILKNKHPLLESSEQLRRLVAVKRLHANQAEKAGLATQLGTSPTMEGEDEGEDEDNYDDSEDDDDDSKDDEDWEEAAGVDAHDSVEVPPSWVPRREAWPRGLEGRSQRKRVFLQFQGEPPAAEPAASEPKERW